MVKVKDIMKRNVITVDPSLMVSDAAKIMTNNRIGSVIVLDKKMKPIDIVTDEGTILKGLIKFNENIQLNKLIEILKVKYDLQDDEYIISDGEKTVQIPIYLLEKIAINMKKNGFNCYISEYYPTADNLEVERTPLT